LVRGHPKPRQMKTSKDPTIRKARKARKARLLPLAVPGPLAPPNKAFCE